MPYRDELHALNARLRSLADEKEALELRIHETVRALDARRDTRRPRATRTTRWTGFLAVALGVAAIALLLVTSSCGPWCGHPSLERLRRRATQADAVSVHAAAMAYSAANHGACPDAVALLDEGYVEPWATVDAWDQPLLVRCGVQVGSAGPDGELSTDDDLWYGGR